MKRRLVIYAALVGLAALFSILAGCAAQVVMHRGKSWGGGRSTGEPVLIVEGRP